ncbi:L-2-hydroxyglutarate oxidase LhgO [bacterium HR40]|nr:L-2-hydroxyglutarate oxidase LhgO [bacterium HR40]
MEEVEAVVIGAGVVGLAVARALALSRREVWVLERAASFGSETSSRNSEVIHAGLYYPPGSLKARCCLAGKAFLYAYCAERGIPFAQLGKLVVATSPEQEARLRSIAENARACGMPHLEWWDAARIRAEEPALDATAALFSPTTGIVDSHALMLAYLADAESEGAGIAYESCVLGAEVRPEGGFVLEVATPEPFRLKSRILVLAAGLEAPALARRIRGLDPRYVPQGWYCKGSYFVFSGRSPFRHLIYPVPEAAGLGIHVTLDLAGTCRFGPDVEWVEEIDYDVDPARSVRFYEAIRRYFPDLPDGSLAPGYAGIRPKIAPPGAPAADFAIRGPAVHGIPGLVCLFGIESPGLTASAAIADLVLLELGLSPLSTAVAETV